MKLVIEAIYGSTRLILCEVDGSRFFKPMKDKFPNSIYCIDSVIAAEEIYKEIRKQFPKYFLRIMAVTNTKWRIACKLRGNPEKREFLVSFDTAEAAWQYFAKRQEFLVSFDEEDIENIFIEKYITDEWTYGDMQ